MTMETMICSHELCTCVVGAAEEFCSDQCASTTAGTTICGCEHVECEGNKERVGGLTEAMPPHQG